MEDYTIELPSHEELEAVTGRIREADCAWSSTMASGPFKILRISGSGWLLLNII